MKKNLYLILFDLLVKYQYDIDNIQRQFSLLVDYEYMLIMLNFKLVQQVESLHMMREIMNYFLKLIKEKICFLKIALH